jgi:hypothetical protein
MSPPEAQSPQGDSSGKCERTCYQRHRRRRGRCDSCTGGEYCLAKSNDQEKAATFQHIISVELDSSECSRRPGMGCASHLPT